MRPPLVLSVLLLCAALSACGADSPAQRYEHAITPVEGVTEVEVEHASHAGLGDSTDVLIVADTNDRGELQRVLDQSLRAFIESTDAGDATSLNFLVYSQDRATYLTPSDLGSSLRSLSDIRRHYGLS